jgi:hypothetical protein
VVLSVSFELVSPESPFYSLSSEWNALSVTLANGETYLARGRGASRWPTSEAVIADVLEIGRLHCYEQITRQRIWALGSQAPDGCSHSVLVYEFRLLRILWSVTSAIAATNTSEAANSDRIAGCCAAILCFGVWIRLRILIYYGLKKV